MADRTSTPATSRRVVPRQLAPKTVKSAPPQPKHRQTPPNFRSARNDHFAEAATTDEVRAALSRLANLPRAPKSESSLSGLIGRVSSWLKSQVERFTEPTIIPPVAIPTPFNAESPQRLVLEPTISGAVALMEGQETPTTPQVLLNQAPASSFKGEGAVFTNRGIGYADYNEDGAVLGVIPKGKAGAQREVVFLGVADEAGGAAHGTKHGQASAIVLKHLSNAALVIAQGQDPEQRLRKAMEAAHREIVQKIPGAASTFAGTVMVDGYAYQFGIGDSAALHLNRDGAVKAATAVDNRGDEIAKLAGDANAGLDFANVITNYLGGSDSNRQLPTFTITRTKVEPGDRFVSVTDGVLDAHLTAQKRDVNNGKRWNKSHSDVTMDAVVQIAGVAATSASAASGVAKFALNQQQNGEGKPDNTTAVAYTIT